MMTRSASAASKDNRSESEKCKESVNNNLMRLNSESVCVWEAADVSTNKLNMNTIILDSVPKSKHVDAIDVARALAESVGIGREKVIAAYYIYTG